MVTLTIDGKEVSVEEGTSILDAARRLSIEIPTLCYHEKLSPIGSCRLCVVEIEGIRDPMAACSTPVQGGIKVITQSERLKQLRKEALQYILLNHPLECPVCDKAGECRLQDLCFEFGITHQDFEIEAVNFTTDYDSPLIERHDARCIRCGRCVSICNEIQGVHAIDFTGNGYLSSIDTIDGKPLNCEFCGQCISVCPVGALINKLFKHKARAWELRRVSSVCPYCGSGCAIELNVKGDKVLRVTSYDESANHGNLCIRGCFGYGFVHNKERLHSPLIKRGTKLVPVSWKEALNFAAGSIKNIINTHGPDSIAGLGSPHGTNEDNYVFQKFFRAALGTNNVDSIARLGLLRGIDVLHEAIGFYASTNSFDEIKNTQSIFIIGSDLSAEMPVASLNVIKAARDCDAKLIVANPVGSKLDKFSTTTLRYYPNTEAYLLTAIIKIILDRGLENRVFIDRHTRNYDTVKNEILKLDLHDTAEKTGVALHAIEKAAEEIASFERGCIICGGFLLEGTNAVQSMRLLLNIALLTGHIGRESAGCYFAVSRNNLQGLCDMGVTADRLPGYRPLNEGQAITRLWNKHIPENPGLKLTELIEAIERGTVKGLYLMGCDPVMSFPDSNRTRKALKKLDFLMVQDLFSTESAGLAHCVLPAVSFAEKQGSFTNGERRIQWIEKGVENYRNARADWEIIQELSTQLGYPMAYENAWDIFREITEVVPQYKGADRMVKERNGVQWPVCENEEGTRFFNEKDFRGTFFNIEPGEEKLLATESLPFILLTGGSLYHCGTLSTYAEGPMTVKAEGCIEVNDTDANRLKLQQGQMVIIKSPLGEMKSRVILTPRLPEGIVFVPDHFKQQAVHKLIDKACTCLVSIEKGEIDGRNRGYDSDS